MTQNIFIDGSTGTTAFHVRSLLDPWIKAGDISIVPIADNRAVEQRKAAYAVADLSILCLPDNIARNSIILAEQAGTRILDASSAHRVDQGWVYGFPEWNAHQAGLIAGADKVTNPGCFATGAVSILKPLVDAGVIDKSQTHTILGLGGYSAGGKKLITKFEDAKMHDDVFPIENAVTQYGLNGPHKHVKEIQKYAGLEASPIFMPHTLNIPRGMMVTVAFNAASLSASKEEVLQIYSDCYHNTAPILGRHNVVVSEVSPNQTRMNLSSFVDVNLNQDDVQDRLQIHVSGWEQGGESQVTIHALLDNLGKGAATQAVQNARLMLGLK